LKYTFRVVNRTPVPQNFVLDDPIPEHTTYVACRHYDQASNSVHWEGKVGPWSARRIYLWVRVDTDAPVGTIITNEAYLTDDALGDIVSVTTEVVE
jgi:hypothetical protein